MCFKDTWIFLRDFIHKKIKTLKNLRIKNKENKISHKEETPSGTK